ncbi:hypothetical protein [Paracandidimonas soli]|uniref:Uncharacterized protein n=1 Tax=Paracandidimonas soli TaxID=1917182 RepID=A0A4R3V6D1_9BURK|nr:hypothetical protein [Paracandidimonas soli]TCU98908.1 hypothetical protein EV686_1042 [Paracandidimonas soli]
MKTETRQAAPLVPIPAITQPLSSNHQILLHQNPLSTERQLIEYLKNAYPNVNYR